MRKDYRLGAIVGIYILFKNHAASVEENMAMSQGSTLSIGGEITRVIIEEIFGSLSEYQNQDPLLIKCELEVIVLFCDKVEVRSPKRIGILKNVLTQYYHFDMVPHVVVAMLQLGFDGLREVIDIAERDVQGLQTQILEVLIQMRVMQRLIIVPSILAQLNQSSDPVVKQESLAMLNRLGTLVWESGGLPLLIELLDQGSVDRHLVASVLRTSGFEGE
jgi:hypothetical protein